MNATDVAVIIAAGTQAATVIVGIGALSQKLTDVRDDMRDIKESIQSCLQTLLLTVKGGGKAE